ncbi:MAG: hypothetical protein DYH15_08310 [Nitrosomonas sp. PRO4]|nr:hypothetical protein [Nitrosomonas sp. PRO4]
MITKKFKFSSHTALGVAILLLGASQNAFSHTRLEIPTVAEGVRVTNNVVIGHSCGEGKNTIASTVVFPDGVDSTVKVNGAQSAEPIESYVSNYGNLYQKILDHSVFQFENEKKDSNGNVVGFWVKGGKMPEGYTVYLPFRAGAMFIEPASCAKSVKVVLGIADICKVTPISGFKDGVLETWTPAVGSKYDGVGLGGYDSPATLTVMRDLVNNPMDASCGDGVEVEIIPSAAQLDRDMPIINTNGAQYWPKP